MIITDTSSESTRKSTLGSSSEQGSDERSSLLTNRREEQEGGGAPPPYGAYSQDGMIDTPGAGDGGKVALGRFFKSLGVAVLIWFLGWAVLSSILMPYDRPKWKHRPSRV